MNQDLVQGLDAKKNTLDKKGNIRFDYVFSYWIFMWFLVYYFANPRRTYIEFFIKKYVNPKIALYFALVENMITFVVLMVFQNTMWTAVKFICMMIVVKIIPLYLLRNAELQPGYGLSWMVVAFVVYNVYLFFNDTNIYDVYARTIYSLLSGRNDTPLFHMVDETMKWIQKWVGGRNGGTLQ